MTLTDIQKQVFETILQRMLSRVTSKVDKREGAVIYDATSPAAMEFESIYFVLQEILKESFADTASREYLIRKGAERGLSPTTATNAILKACFDIDVPIGSRYSLDSLNYTVLSRMNDLCTNVDFYSGFVYEAMGLPTEVYTPLFAMSRITGWTAHRIEELNFASKRIIRPAYKNVGDKKPFVPLNKR